MAYITLAEIKAYLTIPTATTSDDVMLASFITSAQAMIDAHCHRTFEAAADTEKTYDAVADVYGDLLEIDDLCSITSITNGDGTTITSGQYVTEPRRTTPYTAIRLLSSASITWTYTDDPEDAITIDGKQAYSTSAGNDIKQACLRLSAWLYRQKDTNADIDRPLLSGDGVVIMPSTMPSDVIAILRPYRRRI